MSKEKKKETSPMKKNIQDVSLAGYAETLADLKNQILDAQLKASISVNRELMCLYWKIGSIIIGRQMNSGWGSKVIDRLTNDLRAACPTMKGLSLTNVKYMVQFAKEYPDFLISQAVFGQITWSHNIVLLQKLRTKKERVWYAKKTIENGWSNRMLVIWIENNLYNREGKAIINFKDTLPVPQSDLAQQVTKDPYIFDFLSMDDKFREREFEPEFAGKMNFYLGAVDRLLKKKNDNPSIGLILCKSKSKLQVEVALQDINKPIGVSDYIVAIEKGVPKELVSSLPTIEEIEAELREIGDDTNDHSP